MALVSWVCLAVARCKIIAVTDHRLFSANPTKKVASLTVGNSPPPATIAGIMVIKRRAERQFSHILAVCMHHPWITIAMTVAALALSLFGMNIVQQRFFPSSDHAELAIDWNLPHNASIEQTDVQIARFERERCRETAPSDLARRAAQRSCNGDRRFSSHQRDCATHSSDASPP
jgi:hypothetical protein